MSTKIVAIDADRQRYLKFGVNQLIEIEELLGRALTDLSQGASMRDLRTIVYVGLKWEDKTITPEITGDVIDAMVEKYGMEYVSEKLGEAMQKASSKAFPSE